MVKKIVKKLFFVSIFISGCTQENLIDSKKVTKIGTEYKFELYDGIPKPFYPKDNTITIEKAELGRHLFYDKRMSVNNTFSCATCHDQSKAFTDGKVVAEGVLKEKHTKNSMSLTNVGYSSILTWGNPNFSLLEVQMLGPIFGENPHELGMLGKEKELLEKLKSIPKYKDLFKSAFPEQNDPITLENITKSIATFERTLTSFNSPYDKYEFGKDPKAISEQAKRGRKLFFSEKFECFHCHGGFNFSDSTKHEKTVFTEFGFHNNGLYNINNNDDYPVGGKGIYDVTLRKEDIGKFKAPTLRNIEVTSPYMHDGSISTLEEVLDHYARGGRVIKDGANAGDGSINKNKSGFVKGFDLSKEEKDDLLAFLKSLTDKDFLTNPKYSDPWK